MKGHIFDSIKLYLNELNCKELPSEQKGFSMKPNEGYIAKYCHQIKQDKLSIYWFRSELRLCYSDVFNQFQIILHNTDTSHLVGTYDLTEPNITPMKHTLRDELYKIHGYDKTIARTHRVIWVMFLWMRKKMNIPRDIVILICRKVFETRFNKQIWREKG